MGMTTEEMRFEMGSDYDEIVENRRRFQGDWELADR